jgi:hypothetical protein
VFLVASFVSVAPAHAETSGSPLGSAIEYRRSGGFAGVDDRIIASPDGDLEVRDRQHHRRRTRLSPGDLKELASLLSGWKDLRSPSDPPPPDAFVYSITYEGATVTAVEFASAPPAFDLVRKRLEGLAERAR